MTGLTRLKNTLNNLHPPLRTFLFPAKLIVVKVPLTSSACNTLLNAASSSMHPRSSLSSVRPHSIVRTSASASAACRVKGVSRVYGGGGGAGVERSNGRRRRERVRGYGEVGRFWTMSAVIHSAGIPHSSVLMARNNVEESTHFERPYDSHPRPLLPPFTSRLVQQDQPMRCPVLRACCC